jgi:hypothetical protein
MPLVATVTVDHPVDFVPDRYSTLWGMATVGAYSYQVVMVEVGTIILELVAMEVVVYSTVFFIMLPGVAALDVTQIQPPTQAVTAAALGPVAVELVM